MNLRCVVTGACCSVTTPGKMTVTLTVESCWDQDEAVMEIVNRLRKRVDLVITDLHGHEITLWMGEKL